MPELPEVETVRRSLELHLGGRTILSVGGRSIGMRRPLQIEALARVLPGRQLAAFRRRGKYLLLDLDKAGTLLIHLGMSGKLLIRGRNEAVEKHTHLRLFLDDDRELHFVDARRFGFAHWLDPGEEETDPSLSALGPEPLDDEIEEILPPRLKACRSPIKALLLNQHVVAGVGNIYANEALWRAGIDPRRIGRRISLSRLENLTGRLREVLSEAIEQGGTTLKDYATPEGSAGYFAVRLQVYGRGGLPCHTCGSSLKEGVIAGRSTVWCPECQR